MKPTRSHRKPEHSPRSTDSGNSAVPGEVHHAITTTRFRESSEKTGPGYCVIRFCNHFSIRFPIFLPLSFSFRTRRRQSFRDTCAPYLKRRFFADESRRERERDRDLKKNCFRIYRISLAALCRRFLIFYSATRNTISVRDFSNRSLSSRGIRLARDERVIVAN